MRKHKFEIGDRRGRRGREKGRRRKRGEKTAKGVRTREKVNEILSRESVMASVRTVALCGVMSELWCY